MQITSAGPPDQTRVAVSRERFLTDDLVEPPGVRGPILASWRRSVELKVAADRIEMSYVADLPDTRLTRSAKPVLRSLEEQLEGQSVSVILTDPTGLVLSRLTGDGDLERHLDRVLLAPGFSYAEKFVGTNGIGTAIEVGGPTHVFGHEHYAENLEELACAGVPIHHPISGRLVGAVDLTCWRKDAGALLLTLAKATAEQIRQSLLADAGSSQLALFQEYMRTCNRRTGVVVAMNNDVTMLNEYARTTLDPGDQAALLAQAVEALGPGHQTSFPLALPSGRAGHLHCRVVGEGGETAGIVAHVAFDPPTGSVAAARQLAVRMPLPGLVGSGPPWLHACREVEAIFRSGDWLAVEGEPGVGKLALLKAVQLRRQPVGRFVVFEAATAAGDRDWLPAVRRALLVKGDTIVIRHADRLDAAGLRGLTAALRAATNAAEGRTPWVAITLGRTSKTQEILHLLRLFPRTLEVPPLRLHLEDLHLLVPLFLSRLALGGRLTCSPEAMRLLMRMSWPGNVEQVHQVLREVVKHRRTGSIEAGDLPPEAHTVSRRVLSSLESMERDAIVRCLADAGGNKLQAARALGMSRATIYRKIHDYGIVSPRG